MEPIIIKDTLPQYYKSKEYTKSDDDSSSWSFSKKEKKRHIVFIVIALIVTLSVSLIN